MRYRLLGPIEVRSPDGTPVEVGGAKPRTLLTLLLSEAGRVVSLDRVVHTLWGDHPPAAATATVQSYVSQLRRLLGRESIATRAPGYLAAAGPDELDLTRLPALVADAETAEPAAAAKLLTEAVELWRGVPLADLPDDPLVAAERARLGELHLLARQRRAAAWNRLNRTAEAVTELERLVAEQPLREPLWASLIASLYAAGRQADALEAYRRCVRVLADELGLDPGPELRELEQAVLRQDLPFRQTPAVADADRPLAGRRAEQARLRSALAEVTRGSGAVIVLEGEAGIGKTRLAEAATALAGAQGWRSVWSRCADDAGVPPLWPWLQVLDRLGGGSLAAGAQADPDQSTFALFQELRRHLATAAAAAPLLVVLDDVQAADTTSLELLALLARHLDDTRLLVVVTVRTLGEELAPAVIECLATLAREPRAQRLRLTGLAAEDVRELIAARSGPAEADALAAMVHERSDGNPFFAGELVELVHAEGRADALPPSVRDVLDRRLARLPGDTVGLLRLAAVIGRDADLSLLQAAAELDGEQVITRLEPAVATRVLIADEAAWRWRFSHALVQEVLLAGLGRLDAARLHARVARALEGGDVDRLAHHYFHAVPVTGAEPARRYATEAATAAREQHAHTEAATHSRRALSLLGPDPAERHRLLVALGDDLLRAGRPAEAQPVVAEAIAVARRLGDDDRLAEAASVWGGVTLWNWRDYGVVDEELVALLEDLDRRVGEHDPALRARLLGTLGVELAYSHRRADRVAYAERAVELARGLDDPALLGRTINNYMITTWGNAGRAERWLAATDEALALAGRGLPLRTEFFARLHRGPLLLHLGDAAGFADDLAVATRLGARLTGPDVRPYLLYQETGRAMLLGRWAEAEQHAIQAYQYYGQTSMWGARFCWALHQFTFRRRDGRLGEVLDMLTRIAEDLGVPLLHGLAVVAHAEAGEPDRARALRRRWPHVQPEDWTSDSIIAVRAWEALALGGDLAAAYEELLPYAGRQIVVGTAGACWGSYDALLAVLTDSPERTAEHRAAAARLGAQVGSPWQDGTSAP